MCGEALKSEIAFQEEDAHEIHTGPIAGDTTVPDSETGGDAGTVCPAARTRLRQKDDRAGNSRVVHHGA